MKIRKARLIISLLFLTGSSFGIMADAAEVKTGEISVISGMEAMNAYIQAGDNFKELSGLSAEYIIEDGDYVKLSGKAEVDLLGKTAHVLLENTITGEKDEVYLRGSDVFGRKNGGGWKYAVSPLKYTEFEVLDYLRSDEFKFDNIGKFLTKAQFTKDSNGNISIDVQNENAEGILKGINNFLIEKIPESELLSPEIMGNSKKADLKIIISPSNEIKSVSLLVEGGGKELLLALKLKNYGKTVRVMIPEEVAEIKN